MIRIFLRFLVALSVMLLGLGVFAETHSPVRAADDASVDIVDFGFSASDITIEAGATVVWTNIGAATHTVSADDSSFDSGDIAPGDTFSLTFDTPGTFTYHCNFHSSMTGSITVTEASDGGDVGTTGSGDTGSNDAGDTTTPAELPETGVGASNGYSGLQLASFALALLSAAGFLAGVRRRITHR